MPSFPLQAVLSAKDKLTGQARKIFGRVERQGKKAAKKTGTAFSARGALGKLASIPGLLGIGSVAGLASVAGDVLQFERVLQGIATQAGFSAAQTNGLRKQMTDLSNTTGISRDQIAAMADTVINLEGASGFSAEKLELLAKTKVATGAEARDLASVMFALNQAFFKGEAGAKRLEPALSAVVTAGKEGSIPLAQMATVLQQNAAGFAPFAKQGRAGAAQVSAALQAMRTKGFGSAAEAGTGLKALLGKLQSDSKKLRKEFGVRVFKKVGGRNELRSFDDILNQIVKKTKGGDLKVLAEMFKDTEARKAITALIQQKGMYDRLTLAASNTNAVQDDYNKNISSTTGQVRVAMTQLRNTIESAFTPEVIEAFTVALKGLVLLAQAAGSAFKFVGDHVGDVLIKLDGLEERLNKQSKADQLLSGQAKGFRKGGVQRQQALNLAQRGVAPEDIRLASAQEIVKRAEGMGLVQNGELIDTEQAVAKVAETKGLGGIFQPTSEKVEITRESQDVVRGVLEALEVLKLRQGEAPRQLAPSQRTNVGSAEGRASVDRHLAQVMERVAKATERHTRELERTRPGNQGPARRVDGGTRP